MNIAELGKYEKWIGKSPVEIRKAVLDAGGWAGVFPMRSIEFPEWASRVRNFFNMTPVTLELLPPAQGDRRLSQIKNKLGINIWKPLFSQLHLFALNGDVYIDETGRPWFEMDKLGTIYHFPGDVNLIKKAAVIKMKYSQMPVFKLISPDGTGGSLELCVVNRNHASTFGEVGEVVQISPWLVRNEIYRGSYNYAETIIRGLKEHEYRDVESHSEESGFYLNPPLYSSLVNRRFPQKDNDGKQLGFEKGMEPYHFDNTRPEPPMRKTTVTDPLEDAMDSRYPPNEQLERLKRLFLNTSRPKRLLERIQQHNAKDKAVNDFHKLRQDTKTRLLQILKDRPHV